MADGDALILGNLNLATKTTTLRRNLVVESPGRAIQGRSTDGGSKEEGAGFPGVQGRSKFGPGVEGVADVPDLFPAGVPPSPSVTLRKGPHCGVYGLSGTGVGIVGRSSALGGSGIEGSCDSGAGVKGLAKSGTGVRAGSVSGIGVHGSTDTSTGVRGDSVESFGVYGSSERLEAIRGEGARLGVGGTAGFAPAVAGPLVTSMFFNPPIPETGVFGFARGVAIPNPEIWAIGVLGTPYAPPPPNSPQLPHYGVVGYGRDALGRGVAGGTVDGIGVYGSVLDNGTGKAAQFDGDVWINGSFVVDLSAPGRTKSAAIRQADGTYRLLYCVEATENWFEDLGTARMRRGRARVRIERDFAAAVRLDDYHVFLTPQGDCAGLYVSRKGRSGFEIRELGGGKSTLLVSYRIVARPKAVSAKRMPRITAPPARKKELGGLASALDRFAAKGRRPGGRASKRRGGRAVGARRK